MWSQTGIKKKKKMERALMWNAGGGDITDNWNFKLNTPFYFDWKVAIGICNINFLNYLFFVISQQLNLEKSGAVPKDGGSRGVS